MSSYKQNNYGNIFRALILAYKPQLVVECGVLDGYSTIHIAHALRFNKNRKGINSKFFAYDLFEYYKYKHGSYEGVDETLLNQNLLKYCTLIKMDAFVAAKEFKDSEVDFLHMDISNDGDILIKTLEVWGSKISENGIIAFEGGSQERDNGWIKTYGKKPIRDTLINNSFIYKNWDYQIFKPFPSLTLLWKK